MIAGGIYGAIGASADPNASVGSIVAGTLAGAFVGGAVGLIDPSLGAGTLAIVGGAAAAAGDLAGQVVANAINGQPLDNINYGSTLGAVLGGAIGGYGGTVLGNLAQQAGLNELTATALAALLSSGPGTLLPPSFAAIFDYIHELLQESSSREASASCQVNER